MKSGPAPAAGRDQLLAVPSGVHVEELGRRSPRSPSTSFEATRNPRSASTSCVEKRRRRGPCVTTRRHLGRPTTPLRKDGPSSPDVTTRSARPARRRARFTIFQDCALLRGEPAHGIAADARFRLPRGLSTTPLFGSVRRKDAGDGRGGARLRDEGRRRLPARGTGMPFLNAVAPRPWLSVKLWKPRAVAFPPRHLGAHGLRGGRRRWKGRAGAYSAGEFMSSSSRAWLPWHLLRVELVETTSAIGCSPRASRTADEAHVGAPQRQANPLPDNPSEVATLDRRHDLEKMQRPRADRFRPGCPRVFTRPASTS